MNRYADLEEVIPELEELESDLEQFDEFDEFSSDELMDFERDWESESLADEFDLEDDLFDFEDADDFEGIDDFADELDGLDLFDAESFGDFEDIDAADPFLGKLFSGLGKVVRRGVRALGSVLRRFPLFKALAPIAARVIGGVVGGPAGAKIGGTIASAIMREADFEEEGEAESALFEDEAEFESVGGDLEAYAEMEQFAALAAEAENEDEADQFLGSLAKVATRLFKSPRIRRHIPRVVKAATALAKVLRGNTRTRWAVRLTPLIVRRTLTRLSKTRRITRRAMVQAMARETAWVLANKKRAAAGLKQHQRARSQSRSRRGGVKARTAVRPRRSRVRRARTVRGPVRVVC